jgi:hypothetical protein
MHIAWVAEPTSHLWLCGRPADPDPAHPEEKTDSGGGCFVHLADIVPTRSHMKRPWNQAYDLDALRTMEVKADYLGRAIADGWWCRSRMTIEYWRRRCATIADGSR